MKEAKITLEEHKEMGRLAKIFSDKLVKEKVRIINEAGSKTEGKKKAINHTKAIKSLSEFRDKIEEVMVQDYPEIMEKKGKEDFTDIYYGKR